MYLLDTNVVSELRRPKPHGAVVAWIERVPEDQLHVSAVTLGELQAGVEITRDQAPEKAAILEAWLDQVARTRKILPMDGAAFREWARIMNHRSHELIEDAMIAATAVIHNLTVVTRNVRDFAPLGVPTLNPFTVKRPTR